jgi:GST-like protein
MIDLYYWTTPNGHKLTIFLEETGLPYALKPVDIYRGEQFDPAFLAISPNNRIPAIVDHAPADGGPPLALMESGAILEYLATKCRQLLPEDFRGRWECLQWVHWQMGNLGPMAGQTHHFVHYAPEKIPYAIDRYVRETGRLYRVMDRRLADREYLAGDYSIADIACYPWVLPQRQEQDIEEFPHLARWREAIRARPAVHRAYELAKTIVKKPPLSEAEVRRIMFGQSKDTVR